MLLIEFGHKTQQELQIFSGFQGTDKEQELILDTEALFDVVSVLV